MNGVHCPTLDMTYPIPYEELPKEFICACGKRNCGAILKKETFTKVDD